ncbi:hypothetical protein AB0E25_33090 [Streptomyces bobili]|uniref:hypothetical protein n=1 Tax=Streptomyces bobili TaxID=67280 RepID=UPI0033C8AA8F
MALRRPPAVDGFELGLVGPIRARSTRQPRKGTVFHREAFSINWIAKEVTCPQDKVSRRWPTPPPLAPCVTVQSSRTIAGSAP